MGEELKRGCPQNRLVLNPDLEALASAVDACIVQPEPRGSQG